MNIAGIFNSKKTFWIGAVGLHLFAFIWQISGHLVFTKDSYEYIEAAGNFFGSDDINNTNPFFITKRTLGYPFFLWILGLKSTFVFFVQNCLSLFNLWLLSKLVNKQQPKFKFIGLTLLLILSPAQIIYANLVMAEILLQSVVFAIFYLLIQYKKSNLTWVSVLICLSFLIKPITFLWIICWPVFLVWKYRKSFSVDISLFALFPLFIFSVVCFINYKKTDVFHLSSQGSINKFHYNAYGVLLAKIGVSKSDSIMDIFISNINSQPNFKQKLELQNHIADSIIKSNLIPYIKIHFKGCIACMTDPGRFDIATFFNLPNDNGFYATASQNGYKSVLLKIKSYGPAMLSFLVIMIAGALWKWWRIAIYFYKSADHTPNKIIVLFILSYFIFLAGPVGSSRFLVPVYPIIFYAILCSWPKSKVDA